MADEDSQKKVPDLAGNKVYYRLQGAESSEPYRRPYIRTRFLIR
jgi:hypothetical protein